MSTTSPKSPQLMNVGHASRRSAASDAQFIQESAGGKVMHDSRGNAIWDWAVATGVLAGAKAGELLLLLDDPGLAIEGAYAPAVEWAGDPYNRR